MRMLEVFAGSKRLAKTFMANGWEADTVELKDGQDVMTFEPVGKYDYVHAAPPCQEYSWMAIGRTRDDILGADTRLWRRAEDLAIQVRAQFYTIENVKMAQWVHGRAPFHYGPYFLWGWYPEPQLSSGPLWRRSFKGSHFNRRTGEHSMGSKTTQQREEYPQEFCDALYQTIQSGFDLQPVEIAA